MKVATVAIAYNEARFIRPHLKHIPDWIDENLVLVSTKPWNGEPEPNDGTADIARSLGATVIEYDWPTEQDQRNAGQEYLSDYDYIVVLDPDEFLDNDGWNCIKSVISEEQAFVVAHQRVFYKHSEVYPHTDYQQIILVKPSVRFIDNRVVNTSYATLPVDLFHFSWARTDDEILRKITHYGHAGELLPGWYENVWLLDRRHDLHPKSPHTLEALIDAKLPPELERLDLWPPN